MKFNNSSVKERISKSTYSDTVTDSYINKILLNK